MAKVKYRTYFVVLSDAHYEYAMTTEEMPYNEAKKIYDAIKPLTGTRLYLRETAYDENDNIIFSGENMEYKDG